LVTVTVTVSFDGDVELIVIGMIDIMGESAPPAVVVLGNGGGVCTGVSPDLVFVVDRMMVVISGGGCWVVVIVGRVGGVGSEAGGDGDGFEGDGTGVEPSVRVPSMIVV
jgi:hypothetical protein